MEVGIEVEVGMEVAVIISRVSPANEITLRINSREKHNMLKIARC